jgi:pyruvate kinase
MEYEIVATLGPSSQTPEIWERMIRTGVTAFRLNTSHLTLDRLQIWIQEIQSYFRTAKVEVPLVLDLQGSKWRLGKFDPFELISDRVIQLIQADSSHVDHALPVPHGDFFAAASSSSREILLNDAKISLQLESVEAGTIHARVLRGGMVSPGKGITYLSSDYRKEALNQKDGAILEQTQPLDFLRYAISYVRDAAEMAIYRSQIGKSKYLIAKLERKPAVEEAISMAEHADEIWLCRGDLGAELGEVSMALAVHDFSERVRRVRAPALMAGQVLEHMTNEPTPTRSEVCYLLDSLRMGYRGFVLSDETAIGRYPLESCRTAALFKKKIG